MKKKNKIKKNFKFPFPQYKYIKLKMWSQPSNLTSKFIPITEVSQVKTNLTQIYKTPIIQTIIQNQTYYPFNFDLNQYFENLISTTNPFQIKPNQFYQNPFIQNQDFNLFLFKTSFEKTNLNKTPSSEYKIHNENNNYYLSNKNDYNFEGETKKNLYEIFNSTKQKESKNYININNNSNKIYNSNLNLFSTPQKNNIKNKKIFECSISSNKESLSSIGKKKKRSRKNSEQLKYLSIFYSEHKIWTKEDIKKISEETGLKENKVYKWWWDQKNKEYKNNKFVITNNKKNN